MKVTFNGSVGQVNQVEQAETVNINQTVGDSSFESQVLDRLQVLESLIATLPARAQPELVDDIESLRAASDNPKRFSDMVKAIYRKTTDRVDEMQTWTRALQDLSKWAGKAYEVWSNGGMSS